jgi:signal transduction histidine kinase
MRPTPLALRLVVPAVLVALVGWLAALEYHWLDEVSQADRDRRRASLQQHAREFADDFDRELARVYVLLSSAGPSTTPGSDAAFGRRYDAWHEAAADPQVVRTIYRATSTPTGASLAQFDPATHTFKSTAWPEALATIRARVDRPRESRTTVGAAFAPTPIGAFRDSLNVDIPAVMAPAMPPAPSPLPTLNTFVALTGPRDLLIACLDRPYIQSTFLPALAARYFPASSGDPYRLAVIDARHPESPVMTSNWPAGTPVDPDHADATDVFFTLRADIAAQVLQRSFVALSPTLRADRGDAGGSVADARPSARTGRVGVAGGASQSPSLRVFIETQAGPSSSETTSFSAQGPPTDGETSHPTSLTTSVSAIRLTTRPDTGWQLVLQHASGSLDAAVNQARARNLWLSFGLLAVLAAGMVLIVTNAQRSERLATQQIDFVATVSHELRTPLAVIRSAAQNLSAGVVDDPARAKQYGALIDAEGRRLTEMVEQVLDYAGMGGRVRDDAARPVDLGRVAADVVESCAPIATEARVRIEIDVAAGLPAVSGDAQALRSAIQNLVTNALKYGADGGWVGVDVRAGRAGARPAVVVTVRDRGLGVDPRDRRHVFEPFYRGRRAIDAQVRGNGLGLSLVKRVADAHGGRVALEAGPGAGAVFTLSVPIARATAHDSILAINAGIFLE